MKFATVFGFLAFLSLSVAPALASTVVYDGSNGGEIGDTWMYSVYTMMNDGGNIQFLSLRYGDGGLGYGLTQWNLTSNQTGELESCVLSMYLSLTQFADSSNVSVYNTTTGWDESTLTWDTQPAWDALQSTQEVSAVGQYYNFSCTDSALSALNGNSLLSLEMQVENDNTDFNSIWTAKENYSNAPILTLTFGDVNQTEEQNETELIASWSFDDGLGSTAIDSSSNNIDCTIVNGTWVSGKFGGALSLNGDGWASCTNSSLLNFGLNDYFMSFWVNTVAENIGYTVVKGDFQGDVNTSFNSDISPNVEFQTGVDAYNTESNYIAGASVNDGLWHDILIGRSSGTLYMYIDGVFQANMTESPVVDLMNPDNFTFGNGFTVYPATFEGNGYIGSVDELKVYNGVPTENQIANLYAYNSLETTLPSPLPQTGIGAILSDVGAGLGSFLNALAKPTAGILLVLASVAFAITFIMAVATVITGWTRK